MNKSAKAMKAAWTNSRKAAAKFGGKPSEYFAEALRQAWAWVKETSVKNLINIGTIARETEKAVMVNVELELMHSDTVVGVWFPKSQLKDGQAPAWLVDAKIRELAERFRYICRWSFI